MKGMDPRGLALTVGGVGLLRPASGTWGSLVPVGIATLAAGADVGAMPMLAGLGAALVLSSLACVIWGDWAERRWGRSDAGEIVADEVAGQVIALAAVPWADPGVPWWWIAAAFVLFRVFDIAKPPPIDGLQNLPKGWGVLADDLAAGAAAGGLLLAGRAFLA
ncbi:MAG: phosphatidylglycerophosphatase A [Phycisphaerales bacterium]